MPPLRLALVGVHLLPAVAANQRGPPRHQALRRDRGRTTLAGGSGRGVQPEIVRAQLRAFRCR